VIPILDDKAQYSLAYHYDDLMPIKAHYVFVQPSLISPNLKCFHLLYPCMKERYKDECLGPLE